MENTIRIEIILEEAVRVKASDIHLQAGHKPILRINGFLEVLDNFALLDEKTVETLIMSVLDEEQQQEFLKNKELDFSFGFGDLARFRANVFF